MSFEDQKVVFETPFGKEVIVEYDLLIGADGANSNVRKELEKSDKNFRVLAIEPTMSYVGIHGLKVHEDNSKLDGAYRIKVHSISGMCMETVKPGWITFCLQFSGEAKKYNASLTHFLTSDGTVTGVFAARSKFFDFIKGNEQEWVDTVLSNRIPQVFAVFIYLLLHCSNRIGRGGLPS